MVWRSSSRDEDPVPVAASLGRLAARLGVPPPGVTAAVFDAWPEIVGRELAERAKPVALAEGVLVLHVRDTAWSTQLRWMAVDLVNRLNDAVPTADVQRIDVRTGRLPLQAMTGDDR